MLKLTWAESKSIVRARLLYPELDAEKLATVIYENKDMPIGEDLIYRTRQEILQAVTLHDSHVASVSPADTTKAA